MASTIILSDNGVSSGSAGLKETGGNDGVLILQTTTSGGTATNAVYVDNAQNVGINTNSPVVKLTVGAYANAGVNGTAGIYGANISATNTAGILTVGATDSLAADIGGSLGFVANSGTFSGYPTGSIAGRRENATSGNYSSYMQFTTSNSGGVVAERARFNSTGALVFAGGTTTANGIGITFPATQSASSDANTLDDYEEGTWTPALSFGGSSTGITYNAAAGSYTKIGRLVYLTGRIGLSNKGSSTGSMRVTGLPYPPAAPSANSQDMQIGSLWYTAWTNASNLPIIPRTDLISNYIDFIYFSSGSEGGVTQSFINNTSGLSFSICYETT
jgi:hypothetical protein